MKFDVGICAYNERENVRNLLEFLHSENFRNELNYIYVVCSGCTDNTEAVVKEYSIQHSNTILLYEEERCGKPSAINKLLSQKLAPVLIFIAADNIPKRGSIDKLVEKFHDEQVGGVNGHPIPKGGFEFNEIMWIIHHYYLKFEDEAKKLIHLTGEFCAFRPVLSPLPLDVLCDDAWMATKLKHLKYKITYEPDAISYFKSPINISEYVKQRSRNLWGHSQIKHRTLTTTLFNDPVYTIRVLISALKDMNVLRFLFMVFIELYCLLKSKFYKRGNMWDKIDCTTEE